MFTFKCYFLNILYYDIFLIYINRTIMKIYIYIYGFVCINYIGTWRPSIAGSLHYDIKRLLVYCMELN